MRRMTGPRREGPGYREHRPAADLAPWIECFWTRAPDTGAPTATEPYRILPDGCADILFDLTDGVDAFVVGPMTRALVLPPSVEARFLGVRFRPGAAGAFLSVPLSSLVDARVALDVLWRDAAETCDAVVEASAAGRAIDVFESRLRARLRRGEAPPPRIQALVETLAGEDEATSVAALAAKAGITRQHLRRVFAEHVGYGPKTLARILRLRRAMSLIASHRGRRLADLALDAGYYDQAHMNADFRDLAGAPPLALARSIFPRRPSLSGAHSGHEEAHARPDRRPYREEPALLV
jgi:AraC-like DNA-binding protein